MSSQSDFEHGQNCVCDECVFPPIKSEPERLTDLRQRARDAHDPKMGYAFSKRPSWNDVNYVLAELSARDAEIREVLEGLATGEVGGENCWCPDPFRADEEIHDVHCLATQRLWEKLQPAKEANSVTNQTQS